MRRRALAMCSGENLVAIVLMMPECKIHIRTQPLGDGDLLRLLETVMGDAYCHSQTYEDNEGNSKTYFVLPCVTRTRRRFRSGA
jgi:hypothetical protein